MPGLLRWLAVHRALDSWRKLKSRPRVEVNQAIEDIACDGTRQSQRIDELLETVRYELAFALARAVRMLLALLR